MSSLERIKNDRLSQRALADLSEDERHVIEKEMSNLLLPIDERIKLILCGLDDDEKRKSVKRELMRLILERGVGNGR